LTQLSRKQLLYLSNDQLWHTTWHGERLAPGRRYDNDRAGLAALGEALTASAQDGPLYLVADLVEEEFQRHLVPHVRGKAGRALIERKLRQLYRDTPYRYATVQYRDDEGRRDDMVLFAALTNPAEVKPVVQLLEQLKVPLAGLWSVAALSATLVAKLAPEQEHVLLVSQQSGGLRHSYFHRGQLRFSRLTPAVDHTGAPTSVADETVKTRQFIGNSRLMVRNEVLEVTVLGTAAQLVLLERQCEDGSDLIYHFVDLASAADALGVPDSETPERAEQLLLSRLARSTPASHFALGDAARFYQLWQARLGLYGASIVVLSVAALGLCYNLVAGIAATGAAATLREAAAQTTARNRAAAATLPDVSTAPANMKAAVQIDDMLLRQAPMPAPLLGIVSQALENTPLVSLVRVDWKVHQAGSEAAGAAASGTAPATAQVSGPGAAPAGERGPMPSRLFGIPAAPGQTLQIEAEVMLPASQERAALDTMNQFAQTLARQPRMTVSVEKAPVDVRPESKLAGTAGATGPESRPHFILNLVWNP
jgi:hypothetical protein